MTDQTTLTIMARDAMIRELSGKVAEYRQLTDMYQAQADDDTRLIAELRADIERLTAEKPAPVSVPAISAEVRALLEKWQSILGPSRAWASDRKLWDRIDAALEAPNPEPVAVPDIIGMRVSFDVSTGDEDVGNRIFGRVYAVQSDGTGKQVILVDGAEPNYKPTVAVPEGCRLVPLEPTDESIARACQITVGSGYGVEDLDRETAIEIYKAMVHEPAAPAKCPACNGAQLIEPELTFCEACNGTGRAAAPQEKGHE